MDVLAASLEDLPKREGKGEARLGQSLGLGEDEIGRVWGP